MWSLQEPPREDGQAPRGNYFPVAFQDSFGPLPVPPEGMFPHNLGFRRADWVTEEIVEDGEGYDVVLAWVCSRVFYVRSLLQTVGI